MASSPATWSGPRPVAARQVDAAEHVQQLTVIRIAAQGVDDHVLGWAGAVLLHQERGVAQQLRRRLPGDLDGARQPLAHQLARALALVGDRHDGHAPRDRRGACCAAARMSWIAASGRSKSIAQLGAQLQRRDMAGVGREHGLDQRCAFRCAAGLRQHLGERDLQVAGGIGRLGALEQPAQRGDCIGGAAQGEIKAGECAPERAGVGRGGGAGLELGTGGGRAALRVQELRYRQRWAGVIRPRCRLGTQKPLGAVGVAAAKVPLHPRLEQAGIVGKERGHGLELGADGVHVAERLQCRQPRQVQPLVAGDLGERDVDLGQRLVRGAGGEPVGDQHHVCGEVLRILR